MADSPAIGSTDSDIDNDEGPKTIDSSEKDQALGEPTNEYINITAKDIGEIIPTEAKDNLKDETEIKEKSIPENIEVSEKDKLQSQETKEAKFETESLVIISDSSNSEKSDSFENIDPTNLDGNRKNETQTLNEEIEIPPVAMQDKIEDKEEISKTEIMGELEKSNVTDTQRKEAKLVSQDDENAEKSKILEKSGGPDSEEAPKTESDEPSNVRNEISPIQENKNILELENVGELEKPVSQSTTFETSSLIIIDDKTTEKSDNRNSEQDIFDKIEEKMSPEDNESLPKLIQSDISEINEKDDLELIEILSPNMNQNSTIESILKSAYNEGETLSSGEDIDSPIDKSPSVQVQTELREVVDDLKSDYLRDKSDIQMDTNEKTDAEKEVIFYEDRPNSAEPDEDTYSHYIYPLEKEFWEIEDLQDPATTQARWKELYYRLHAESQERMPSQRVARMQHNRPLNRYSNILANDNTRIILTHPDSDYINANLVTVPEVDRRYIMTQGPLNITAEHFWHMVWQEESKGIVMLNKTFESGKLKCFQYFPESPGDQAVWGNFLIICASQFEAPAYRLTNLELTNLSTQETRYISHFQYLTWPDFGAPQTPEDFLQFLVAVREKGILDAELYGPPVIHCSAGVGRSGTFILVDACLRRIEIEGNPTNVHLQRMILQMRDQRHGCIQSEAQLRFSYVAILVATHNFMAELAIATVPELVERARQEAKVDSPIPPKRTSSKFPGTPRPDSDSPETTSPDDSPLDITEDPIAEKPSVPTEDFASETQEARQRIVKPSTNPEPPVAEPQLQNNTFKIAIAVIILAILLLLIYIAFF